MPLENLPPDPNFNLWSLFIGGVVAAWGGAVNYLYKLRRGSKKCNFRELIVDMFTSGFAGVTIGSMALGMGANEHVCLALAAMSGHYGARSIFLFRSVLIQKIKRWGSK